MGGIIGDVPGSVEQIDMTKGERSEVLSLIFQVSNAQHIGIYMSTHESEKN